MNLFVPFLIIPRTPTIDWTVVALRYSLIHWDGKVHYSVGPHCLFVLLIITRPGLLAEIKNSVYTSESQRILRVSF